MEIATNTDDVFRKACNAAREGGLIDAAQVRLLGLDDVQASAGPNWPRLKKRAREGSISLIQDHLEPDDVVVPCGDGFLVIFASADATQIAARCNAIREGLVQFYLGEDGLSALRASVLPQTISADALMSMGQSAHDEQQRDESATERKPRFVSVWSLKTNTVAAALCTSTLPGAHGMHVGYDPDFLIKGTHKEQSFLDRDLAILAQATSPAEDGHPNVLLAMQVHASTMLRPKSRDEYIRHLSKCRPSCERLGFMTIAEIERGTPMIAIMEWVSLLRRFTPRVILDFHYADHATTALAEAGAWAASVHLPLQGAAQKAQFDKPALEQLTFWTRATHERRMRLLVHGFREVDFIAKAARLGVDFGTGAFGPTVSAQENVAPLSHVAADMPRASAREYAA